MLHATFFIIFLQYLIVFYINNKVEDFIIFFILTVLSVLESLLLPLSHKRYPKFLLKIYGYLGYVSSR
jgi:hypothetical protein